MMSDPPPLVHFALGALHHRAGNFQQAENHLAFLVENDKSDEKSRLSATSELRSYVRILRKLEFHYTPKHGSWLNMAEIEISVLSRQCLQQRLPSVPQLDSHVTAWTKQRNTHAVMIKWCFNLVNARTKLARLYP